MWRLRRPRARSLQVGILACRRPPSHSRERRERLGQADKERGERERGDRTGTGEEPRRGGRKTAGPVRGGREGKDRAERERAQRETRQKKRKDRDR